ncbi:MAG: hypothetical protein ACRDLF_02780 [Solirubrobacteraceae bacterium]
MASEKANLTAKFVPYRLGANTTILIGFRIASHSGGLPAPLTHVTVALPASLGFAATTLGLATCDVATLMERGPSGCPPDAEMGFGTAIVEVPFGPEILRETGYVTTVMAPSTGTQTKLLFYAEGRTPVSASLVFPGELLSEDAGSPFGTLIETAVPLIPSLPGGPFVSVTRFETTFGPEHLTYIRYAHGKRVGYRPVGIAIPKRCPRDGFKFAATFSFADGTDATATSIVQCPHSTRGLQ